MSLRTDPREKTRDRRATDDARNWASVRAEIGLSIIFASIFGGKCSKSRANAFHRKPSRMKFRM
jgi:hypothetical protein